MTYLAKIEKDSTTKRNANRKKVANDQDTKNKIY